MIRLPLIQSDSSERYVNVTNSAVNIPLTDPVAKVRFGSVGSILYRDTVNGVRFTAHYDTVNGVGWIVRHAEHRADSDGDPVMRSALLRGEGTLNSAWHVVRNTGN